MNGYKAKRKNWKELPKEDWWVRGNLLTSDEQYFIVPEFGVCCVEEYKSANTDRLIHLYAYEVDSETVSRDTGLTDKNGTKIFEGDIINDINYGIMRCMYLHGSFVWYKEDGFHIKCMNYIPVIEVIGNIFDNLELVKEG